jgi:hypothetical protein
MLLVVPDQASGETHNANRMPPIHCSAINPANSRSVRL